MCNDEKTDPVDVPDGPLTDEEAEETLAAGMFHDTRPLAAGVAGLGMSGRGMAAHGGSSPEEFVIAYVTVGQISNGFTVNAEFRRNPNYPPYQAPTVHYGAAAPPMAPVSYKEPETYAFTSLEDALRKVRELLG